MHMHNISFQHAASHCEAPTVLPFGFPFQDSFCPSVAHTGVSLLILPTIAFVIPSQETDAVHMIGRQLLFLLADDQPAFEKARSDVALEACAYN